MSERDLEILDQAYSTTYKSTLRRLLGQAESEECRRTIEELITQAPE